MAVTYFVRMRALEGREDAVRELLLSNVARIDAGERGSVVFAVHASKQDPREFWLYETWTDAQAVEAHESGPAFKAYKDDLRPLVDPTRWSSATPSRWPSAATEASREAQPTM
jgi:quinol monooxygenase YgiN